jgi:hypothetical protein
LQCRQTLREWIAFCFAAVTRRLPEIAVGFIGRNAGSDCAGADAIGKSLVGFFSFGRALAENVIKLREFLWGFVISLFGEACAFEQGGGFAKSGDVGALFE